MKDDSPDAWVIMLVGNSSGVMKKTAPNVNMELTCFWLNSPKTHVEECINRGLVCAHMHSSV